MRFLLNIFALCILCNFSIAQHYNVWQYFGAKLDFNTEPPTYTIKKDGSDDQASISDSLGQLLFYTGGYYEKMPGKLNPYGSSIKNANGDVIVPLSEHNGKSYNGRYLSLFIPLNDSIYYFFYCYRNLPINVIRDTPVAAGIYYTQFNINLNNGKGGIVKGQKDVRASPIPCQNLSAIKHENSWWLFASNSDSLMAFKVDLNGFHSEPVITYFDENKFPNKYPPQDLWVHNRIMRFSHDGKKMVSSFHIFESQSYSSNFTQSTINLYDFDAVSGIFTHRENIHWDTGKQGLPRVSDFEFSPDNSKLYLFYFSTYLDSVNPIITQYDLTASKVASSAVNVMTTADDNSQYFINSGYSMLLGMNGKIYISGPQSSGTIGAPDYFPGIGLIWYPNKKGKACKLMRDPRVRTQGCDFSKPPEDRIGCNSDLFPFSRYHNLHMDFDYEARCSDSALHLLNLSDTSKFSSYKWYVYSSTIDGQLLDSSEEKEPYFASIKGGRYYVKLRAFTPKGYGPWFSDTIEHINPALPLANFSTVDSFACRYAKIQFMDLSDLVKVNPRKAPSWTWKFSDGKDTTLYNSGSVYHAFSELGSYDAKLIVRNGFCADSLEKKKIVTVIDAPKPGIVATPSQGCQALEVSFERRYTDSILKAEYRFGDGSPAEFPSISPNNQASGTHTYSTPGVYWLSQFITGPTGCISDDSIPIHVLRGFYPGEQADILLASVQGDSAIELHWDSLAPAKEFQLQRSSDLIKWENVFTNPITQLVDYKVQPHQNWYQYRMMAKDTCGKSVTGLPGTSIHLTGENKDNSVILLKWNPYETWPNGVYTYALEYKNAFGNWLPVIQSQSTTFNDEDYEVDGEEYRCYRVRALNDQNASLESYSNTECVKFLPLIWVPNAFSPNNDGHNDIFKTTCIGISELEIRIYNRYGQLIHTATGINATWDGTLDGIPVPSGVYVYQITGRTSSEHVFFHQEGSVTLLR